jgi:hypothetical protein
MCSAMSSTMSLTRSSPLVVRGRCHHRGGDQPDVLNREVAVVRAASDSSRRRSPNQPVAPPSAGLPFALAIDDARAYDDRPQPVARGRERCSWSGRHVALGAGLTGAVSSAGFAVLPDPHPTCK